MDSQRPNMEPLRPIYYDTETTGLKAENERIVELAAYDPVLDRTFEELINPGIPIPPEASSVHKITDEMVQNAPNFSVIGPKFVEFCQGNTILIAHNNDSFDVHFLRHEFSRNGIEMPDWKFFDTLKWARRYRPDLPRHTLQFLREIYGFAANNAHRALDDVIILHRVFEQMLDDLTVEQALQLMAVKRNLSTMPFGKYSGHPLEKVPKDYVQWLVEKGALDKPDNADLKLAFERLGMFSKESAVRELF